jgi:hypothetical protein
MWHRMRKAQRDSQPAYRAAQANGFDGEIGIHQN